MVQKNYRKKIVKQMWQDNKEETGSDGYIHYFDCHRYSPRSKSHQIPL